MFPTDISCVRIFSADGYEIYENQYPLQFGYTYDTTIARSYYEKLTPLENSR